MSRVPLPKEVRPGFAPFVEAMPLLFRQESLEVAAFLAIAGIGLPAINDMLPRNIEWHVSIARGWVFGVRGLAFGFLDCAFQSAVVFLLVPVAAGERGLRLKQVFGHMGVVCLAAAVVFGVQRGLRFAVTYLFAKGFLPDSWHPRWLWCGPLSVALVVWSAWFLGNALRRRRNEPTARARLLAWPGFVMTILMGGLGYLLPWMGFLGMRRTNWRGLGDFGFQAVLNFGWGLCVVFAALWMLRAVENEAEADPAP